MPSYQPKIKYQKIIDRCSVCKRKRPLNELFIIGIDESNFSITQNACKHLVCKDCLKKD